MPYAAADEVLRRAAALAQNWFRPGGKETLVWEGAAVGSSVAPDTFNFFAPIIKLDLTLGHIRAVYPDARITFVDDGSTAPSFLKAVLPARGIPGEALGGSALAAARNTWGLRARRAVWPWMWRRAGRQAGAEAVAAPAERLALRREGAVFWGQFGGFETDVYRELRRLWGDDLTYVVATIAAGRGAARGGYRAPALMDRRPRASAVNEIYRSLRAQYRALESEGLFEGFGLGPGLAPYLRATFPFRPSAYLITLALRTAAVHDFLETYRPRVIIHMGDAHPTGRLVTTLAARAGIPSLCLQHHITGGPTFGYLPVSSSIFAAWGKVSRDWCLADGAPAERVVIAGSSYAALAARRYRGGVAAGRAGRRDIVVATNNFDHEQNRDLACACAAFARTRADLKLVFRPHPSEPDALYHKIIGRFGVVNGSVARAEPLEEVLKRAAVMITSHSGAGVDAVAAAVPLIHVNLMAGVPDYIPYVEFGAALPLTRLGDLPLSVNRALKMSGREWDARRRSFVQEYLGAGAGDPFTNVCALARELASAR